MIDLTAEAWTLALAACLSLLLSSTTLTLAVQSSLARSRGAVFTLLLSSLALGFGLWTMNFVQVLSVQIPGQANLGISWSALTFAIAASTGACALLFIAGREPDTAGTTGSAFALAVGIEAAHCAAFDELPGELIVHQGWPWVCGSFLVVLRFGSNCAVIDPSKRAAPAPQRRSAQPSASSARMRTCWRNRECC